jgi:hypothetical protein
MKRAILVVATTLVLTAGQAMADGLTPPRQVNLLPDDFHPPQCYCTCLENGCCPHCPEDHTLGVADSRLHVVRTALSSRPNTARPKQFERTTNRHSTPIPGATPWLRVTNGSAQP